jgi:hypothetical protein
VVKIELELRGGMAELANRSVDCKTDLAFDLGIDKIFS